MRLLGWLALRQLRHQRGRWALLAVGVALAAAVPVIGAGVARSVGAQTIRQAVQRLDPDDRTIAVSEESTSPPSRATAAGIDARVRRAVGTLTAQPALRALLFRPLRVSGAQFQLGGVDDPASVTRLTSGRRPTTCVPTRCEVLAIGGSAQTVRAAATLGVVVVGHAQPAGNGLAQLIRQAAGTALLIAGGADPIAALESLRLFSRRYSWTAALDVRRIVSIGVPAYVERDNAATTDLANAVGGSTLIAPTSALLAADQRANVSARRLRLLSGIAAVLLLGFAVVAATNLRRDARQLAGVLRRRGAVGRQVVGITVVEAVAGSLTGLIGGAIAGAVIAVRLSKGTEAGSGSVALHAVRDAAPTVIALSVAAAAAITAVLLWPPTRARALWRTLDLIALASLGAAALAAGRGVASANALATATDPLVVALPVLASVVAGLVSARVWQPAVRLVERMLPRRSVSGRIALLGAIRRPLMPVATAALLTCAVAAVVFAGAYRATLHANDQDQAAYQVPLDDLIRGSARDPVPDRPPAQGTERVFAVVRAPVSITRLPGVVDSIPLVAPQTAALPLAARWSRTTGSGIAPARLARRLELPARPAPALPAGTREISIAAIGADPQTLLALFVTSPDGQETRVDLRREGARLIGRLPGTERVVMRVTAISIDESTDYATHHEHAIGEGVGDKALLSGRLTVGSVDADGAPLDWSWADWGSINSSVQARANQLVINYRIDGAPVVAVPDIRGARSAVLPVVVDPSTAAVASGGRLTLQVDSTTLLNARVVATMPRLPTVRGPFVLAGAAALQTVLDIRQPGRNADEYWIDGAPPSARDALRAAGVSVTSQSAVLAELTRDPVGRGAAQLLAIVALLALGVAAASLMLLVVGERRDGAGELYAWEADGTPPRLLRRMLALRAAAVSLVSVPIGVAAGLLIARVGARLIAVDSSGTAPVPPLQLSAGLLWAALGLAGGVGAGLVAAGAVAAGSLRERLPVPPLADLR